MPVIKEALHIIQGAIMNIQDLVLKAKSNDKKALEKIICKFKPLIISEAHKIYIKGYELDDLMQLGFTSLIYAVSKYNLDSHSNFTAYAITAVKNNFNYEIRKYCKTNNEESLYKEIGDDIVIEDTLIGNCDVEGSFFKSENIKKLRYALKKLNKDELDMINQVYFNHVSLRAYSLKIKTSYNACAKRKERILKKLKRIF